MLTYQNILEGEFIKRQRKLSSYSLRAYARDLGISQSFLTQVLNKKRKLGDQKAFLISQKLKWPAKQRNLFLNLVRFDLSKNEDAKNFLSKEIKQALVKSPDINVLPEDVFNIVSDWWYFAILELIDLPGFQKDFSWMARKLNLKPSVVESAWYCLLRVGLIEELGNQVIKKKKDYVFKNISSQAIRKHHQQTLDLAKLAIEEQKLSDREFMTLTVPADPQKVKRAKELINQFIEDFMVEMQATPSDSIYKLAVQFFRLDKEIK